jgi:hypothetical protein
MEKFSDVENGDTRPVTSFDISERAEKELTGGVYDLAETYHEKVLRARIMAFAGEELNYDDAREWYDLLNLEDHDLATAHARKILADAKHLSEFSKTEMLEEDFDDALLILAACHGDYEKARIFLWKEAGTALNVDIQKAIKLAEPYLGKEEK